MNLSVLQAGEMAAQMALAADGAAAGQNDCGGCAGGDDGTGAAGCISALNCSGFAAVLPVESKLATAVPDRHFARIRGVARDFAAPPELHPPRSLELG